MRTRRSVLTAAAALTVLASTAIASRSAVAQGGPAQPTAPAVGEFQVGPYYAGPRLWVGNLNGAVAIGGQLERGFTKPGAYGPGIIAGGVGVDWYSWDFDYGFGSYEYSVIPLQVFSNYHFVIEANKKFDPYVGLALVYSIVSASWSGSGVAADADASDLSFAGQAGMRYFISDKLALQGQIGFGYGTLGLGATWRF